MCKYLKIFKQLVLTISPQIESKWECVSKLILENMKNLRKVKLIFTNNMPHNFDHFVHQVFQKSQNTLKVLSYNGSQMSAFPNVSLPYVTTICLKATENHNSQIAKFDKFMKNVLKHCEYLKEFYIQDIQEAPQMISHITVNYSNNCMYAQNQLVAQQLPVKIPFCGPLGELSELRYPHAVKSLILRISLNNPFTGGWQNYKTMLALCPNLEAISMYVGENELEYTTAIKTISSENQNIWKERIDYLNSCGVEMIDWEQLMEKQDEYTKLCKWGFTFQDE